MKNFLRSLSKNFPLYFPKYFSKNFLRRFTRHFSQIFPPRTPRLRSPRRGYIAILLVAFIPVILLGTRWVLDTITLQKIKVNMMPVEGETQKKCAAQAALAVAQNWNPGLPLSRQKNTVLKIADAVYNDNTPVVTNDSNILAKAIPGLQLEIVDRVIHSKGFDPVKITSKSAVASSSSPIGYETCKKYSVKNTATAPANFNAPFFSWRIVDAATSSESDLEKFDELESSTESSTDPSKKYVIFHEDRYQSPYAQIVKNSPTREQFSSASSQLVCCANSSSAGADESGYKNIADDLSVPCTCASLSENGTYTKRKTASDNRVQVLIENDKIKVVTDNDVGYALPAQCNVDIVLACPTNAAATNKDNRDKNSDTAGAPCTNESEIASCPIYQIGQAFRGFVKQFYHTRGVTMGLVPYGGKVSLSPEIAEKYTINYAKCNDEHCFYEGYYLGIDPTLKAEDKVEAFLRGAVLYDSCGQKGYDLDDPYKNLTTSDGSSAEKKAPYDWNTALTACPIRCRGPIDDTPYQGNVICVGDIFSTAEPDQSRANTLFFRQNSNPCYGGNANLLSMKCEQTSPTHLPNPYYIIEPTADLQKIYEMCGALYPFYDDKNVSNFIFIPVTWANNLWQDWTRDPGCPASGDNLSIPSKVDDADAGTSGGGNQTAADSAAKRKKALILVINKPDWFEPNELTYLGFDNDFSDLPMIESDRIDFSENYAANADKKFADGTPYDGTIQGAKKILTVSSSTLTYNETTKHYECNNGTVTLKFPRKYLVKVVVEPNGNANTGLTWKGLGKLFSERMRNVGEINWDGSRFIICKEAGNGESSKILTSTDGKNWSVLMDGPNGDLWKAPIFGNGKIIIGEWLKAFIYENGAWITNTDYKSIFTTGFAFGNGIFLAANANSNGIFKSTDGKSWAQAGSLNTSYCCSLSYKKGKWYSITRDGVVRTSTDDGANWTELSDDPGKLLSGTHEWYNIIEAFDNFWSMTCDNSGMVICSNDCGVTWKDSGIRLNSYGGSNYCGLGTNGEVIVAKSQDGYFVIAKPSTANIQFMNISANSDHCTTDEEYKITERREFFIEADQISGSDGNYTINMNLENIRLISAEITNRPYKKINAECKLEGTKIKTNAKKPMTVKVSPTRSGSVTFSNINNSEISNAGAQSFTKTSTFTFPANNFANNYSVEKVKFSLNKAQISSIVLENQTLRIEGPRGDTMTVGYADSNCNFSCYRSVDSIHVWTSCAQWLRELTGYIKFYYSARDLTNCYIVTKYHNDYDKTNDCWKIIYTLPNGTEVRQTLQGTQNNQSDPTIQIDSIKHEKNLPFCEFNKSEHIGTETSSGGGVFWVNLCNKDDCIMNLENMNDVSTGVYLDTTNSNVCFDGAGTLKITVTPTENGIIHYTSPEDAEVTETFTEERTITIDPDNYKYVDDGNGGYIIDLTTDKVTLSDLKFKDTVGPVSCEWEKIRTPDESRVVDFRENKNNNFAFSVCGKEVDATNSYIRAGIAPNGAIGAMETRWNTTKLYWESYPKDGSRAQCEHFWPMSYSGDMYMLADATEISFTKQPYYYLWIDLDGSGVTYKSEYFGTNLYRSFWNFSEYRRKKEQYAYTFETFNTVLPLVYAGFTLPINAILHHAYYDGDAHEGEWYVDESNQQTYDASEAAKNATKKALSVLKSEWGDNLRIYLIFFRKQEKYKHKITGSNTNYSYKYLNDCGDIYAKYDVTTEGDLKTKLNEIASEIKEWAGYEEAMNAENGTTN